MDYFWKVWRRTRALSKLRNAPGLSDVGVRHLSLTTVATFSRQPTFVSTMPTPSCDQCHRRRLHCAGEKPSCYHCKRTGQTCTYSTGKPVGKPKGHRKVKRNSSTEIPPRYSTESTVAQRTLDSTTSDSSPNYSDLNDVGNSSRLKVRPSSVITTTSFPGTADTIPIDQNTPVSTFASPSSSSPGIESGSMRITANPSPQFQQADMDAVYFTPGLAATSMPPDPILSSGANYFGWQATLEHPSTTAQMPFGMTSAPFLPPPTIMGPQPPVLQLPFAYTNHEISNGSYGPGSILMPQWPDQLASSCSSCRQLPKAIASLFESHLTFRGDFDTMLMLVHNNLEIAQNCLACPHCLGSDERHPMTFIMLLHQALACFQRMLSFEVGSDQQGRQFRQAYSDLPPHPLERTGFERETIHMQTSVKLSVVQLELARLQQLAESVRFLAGGAGAQSPSHTLLTAFDEAVATLQRTIASHPL